MNRSSPGLLGRQQAVDYFSKCASALGQAIDPAQLDLLPPFLCHRLLSGRRLPDRLEQHELFVGHDDSRGEFVHGIYCAVDGFMPVIHDSLSLEGHRPIRAPGIYRWLQLALDELTSYAPEALDFIKDWCSAVVWLYRDAKRSDLTELTSTAIPSMPFAVFITRKAIRHLPPKIILPEVTFYGLQENLFHEALHQQLTVSIFCGGILQTDWAEAEPVLIPWRNCHWPVDRALHAAWVSRGLQNFRAIRLETGRGQPESLLDSLHAAQTAGASALSYLIGELRKREDVLGRHGQAMLNSLV